MSFFKKLFRRKPLYVIVYDHGYDGPEEYAGYFNSPAEARGWWNDFKGPGLAEETYLNVKLCKVVEEWS